MEKIHMRKVHGVILGLTPDPIKSSYSSLPTNNCVMIGSSQPDAVEVSDSKVDDGPVLTISSAAFDQMVRDVIAGH